MDQGTRAAGGSLGEIRWATTMPSFQERAFQQEPGVISEPFETPFGVHLLRVDERVPQTLPPLEEARPGLRQDATRQKEQLRMREYTAELEQKAGLAWNEEGLRTLRQAIDEMVKTDQDSLPEAQRNLPPVDDARRQVVLATFAGRNWTIGDYRDALAAQPPPNRPPGQLPLRGLKELIRTAQIDAELGYAEAKARKLDERPEIKEPVARLEEQIMIEMLHSRFLQTVDITPEEVRAFFDSTRAADSTTFVMPERVDMVVIANPDSAKVRDALRRIARGEPEAKVIEEVSFDMRTKSKAGRTGLVAAGSYPPAVEDVVFKGTAGKGWSSLIPSEGMVFAVKVLAHEKPRRAEFDEVKARLTQELAQARGEKAFEEWLTKERETRGVEIYDDALALLGQAVTGPGKSAADTAAGK
jgi:parvulin-like peptidyl-prolyl isomerase